MGKAADGSTSSVNREWKIYGKYLGDADFTESLKNQKAKEINLLAKEAGGRLIASSDPSFENLIDANGDQPGESAFVNADQEAIFGFSGDRTALLSSIEIPIFETSQYNCKTFEFSASETSPSENFTPVGTFKTQNIAVAGNPYQSFKFPSPVRAKYLKMKLIDGHESSDCQLAEVRANGIYADDSSAPAAVAAAVPAAVPPAPVPASKPETPPPPAPPAPAEEKKAAGDFYNDFKTAQS